MPEWKYHEPTPQTTFVEYKCGLVAGDIVELKKDLIYHYPDGSPTGKVARKGTQWVVIAGIKSDPVLWKIYLFYAIILICGCIIIFQGILYEPIGQLNTMRLVGIATALGFLVFTWTSFSIKCSNCKMKLYWYAAKNFKAGSWFTDLLNLSKCPVCGQS